MTKKFNRGFTLIELLVVIAIIGILSSVVLASLNTARGKGSDAAVKSNLNNIRAQAEIYLDDPTAGAGTYGGVGTGSVTNAGVWTGGTGVCSAGTGNIRAGVAAAAAAGGGTGYCNVAASGAAWAAAAPLKGAGGQWCVDSTGQSMKSTGAFTTATVCS